MYQLDPCSTLLPITACQEPQRQHCISLAMRMPQALKFGQKSRLPSIAMLERYGNTGCSSVFYILAHMESTHGVKAGEKVRGGLVTLQFVLLSTPADTSCTVCLRCAGARQACAAVICGPQARVTVV